MMMAFVIAADAAARKDVNPFADVFSLFDARHRIYSAFCNTITETNPRRPPKCCI
jgi:hypothetical protein